MIVLQDPLTQPFSGYGALSTQQPSFGANMLAHTGAIVQRSGPGNINSGSNGASTKKNKVYCDKWVHEGICAFTQQGCKFKHEMPHDRSIQRSLGLFHGYPSWYKKQQAQEQQAREQQPPVTMDAAVPGLQSLPALPAQQQQQQACSSFAPRTAAFVPSLSSIHSGFSCPVSILAVPAAPPPTPVPQQRTMQHAGLFQTSGFYPDFGSNGNSMTGNRMRGGSGSSNGMDSPWRASGVNASSWRTPQPATSTAEHVFGDGSTGQLTDSFARNLSFGEQPLSRVYQSQQLHQQQPAPTPSETGEQLYSGVGSAYPLGFGIGLKSGGNCLGSLGAVDSQANAGGRSSFGPIGPPTRVVAQETTLSTAFAYHGSQDHAHDEQPGDDTGDHSTTKW
ncbi:hypothetical protein SBRCBS47491_000139 [Sporothrix bragantina]|uniref:C3H1-type domain-containing protein n=1 Tax=Sporothrix bragantina TaxID=671064 RepID=A0ABP0AMZ6_9PEZI